MNEIIQRYLNEQKANGNRQSTIDKERPTLTAFDIILEGHIELANKDDITGYILSWVTATESTKATRKIILKKFFAWLGKAELIKDIKVKRVKSRLKADDILTIEDVDSLIRHTSSHYYKAMIAFLFESGARYQEAHALQAKDFKETDKGLLVAIPTFKTDYPARNIVLLYSGQFMRNYFIYAALKPDDVVFRYSKVSVRDMLQKIKKEAGITKPISPHKFRHAQATDMVQRGYNEGIIRRKLGWVDNSTMTSNYIHLNDQDVINATLNNAGSDIPKSPMANLKQPESLKIADATLQLSKLSLENQELKYQVDRLNEFMASIILDRLKSKNLKA